MKKKKFELKLKKETVAVINNATMNLLKGGTIFQCQNTDPRTNCTDTCNDSCVYTNCCGDTYFCSGSGCC